MRGLLLVLGAFLSMTAVASSPVEEAVAFCGVHKALCEEIEGLQPVPTRAGHFRFVGPSGDAEMVAWAFLHRLTLAGDSTEVRSALVPNCAPLFTRSPRIARVLYDMEQEPSVRSRIVSTMGRVEGVESVALLEKASADTSLEVRQVVAAVLGYHPSFEALRSTAIRLAQDTAPSVRAFGIRAIGWRGDASDFERVVPFLADPSPIVRFQTVAALERMNDVRLLKMASFQRLTEDSDPKVAALVTRILHQESP